MTEAPPQARLWPLVRGAMATQAIRVAAEYRVADALAAGPRPVTEVAGEAGLDADALYRFLRALATEGVFAEDEPGMFRNTQASELLRSDHDERWNDFAVQFGDDWYRAFADAPYSVRTGAPAFPRTFGCDFDEWLRLDAQRLERFNRSMEGGATQRIDRLTDVPLDGALLVVDVGSGTGAMMIELLRRYPRLRGVLYDLPDVVAEAGPRVAAAGVAGRCELLGGSFFDGVPPDGDVYLLSRILHGFGDEEAKRVLANIAAGARPGARIVILDAVLPKGNEPHGNKWLDLLMLVLGGGRERTETEWRRLLESAGLHVDAIADGLVQASCP